MPVVLLSIDGNASKGLAAIDATDKALAALDATFKKVAQSAIGLDDAVTRAMKAVSAGVDTATKMLTGLGGAFDDLGASAQASATRQVAAFGSVRDAAALTTTAIRSQILALSDLATMSRLAATGALGTPSAGGGVARAAAQDAALLRGRPLASMGARALGADTGLVSSLGNAAFGPAGLTLAAAGYLGFKSVQAATGYQSAIAQTGAQIGLQAGNPADMAKERTLYNGILKYARTGKDPLSATVEATSIEPLLAHGYSMQAALQGLPAIAQLSAQNKAPDLTTAVNSVNTYLALTTGPKSTGAQITQAADFISRMETLTTIPPGQISTALPRLLAGGIGTGVDANAMGAMLLKVGTANPSARLDSTAITRLISDMLVKPSAGATKTAADLGLAIGPGALASYGGSPFAMLQAYQQATAGPNQTKLLSQMFTQTNALQAAKELFAGGGIGQTLGYNAQLAGSGGAAQQAYNAYSQGIDQQATQLHVKLNADMIELGSTLTATVVPALLHLADGAAMATEGFVAAAASVLAGPGGKGGAAASVGAAADTLFYGIRNGGNWDQARQQSGADAQKGQYLGALGGALGAFGHNVDQSIFGQIFGWATPSVAHAAGLPHATGVHATATLPHSDPAALARARAMALAAAPGAYQPDQTYTGVGGITQARAVAAAAAQSLHPLSAAAIRAAVDAAVVAGMSGPPSPTVTTSMHNYMTRTSQEQVLAGQLLALSPAVKPPKPPTAADRDAATRDVRANINTLLLGGGTDAQLVQGLAALKVALGTSAYSGPVRANIYAQEAGKVRRGEMANALPGDQLAVTAAQQNLDAAQLMSRSPAAWKQQEDAYLAAQRQLASDQYSGPNQRAQLAVAMRGIDQQGAAYAKQTTDYGITRREQDLQNQLRLDSNAGNIPAERKDQAAILDFYKQFGSRIKPGFNASDLAVMASDFAKALQATPLAPPPAFRQNQPGVGALEAGNFGTAVRFGGGKDPQLEEIRQLRRDLAAERAENRNLLAQIARNTTPDRSAARNNQITQAGGNYSANP